MKRLRKIFKELWADRSQILQALIYICSVGWYGFVLWIIGEAEIGIFPKILLCIGGLVLGLFTCISLHRTFTEDDEEI